jgi:hypothetical protein
MVKENEVEKKGCQAVCGFWIYMQRMERIKRLTGPDGDQDWASIHAVSARQFVIPGSVP